MNMLKRHKGTKAQIRMVAAGFSLRTNDERKLKLATTKSLRATRSNFTTPKRISRLLIATIFFLNQINLSVAGILDYVDEPQKNYEEMMSDVQKADMYIGNLNAVIGGNSDAILTNVNYKVITAGINPFPAGDLDLRVNGDFLGKLHAGDRLIFYDDNGTYKLKAIVQSDGGASKFTNVVRHNASGLQSYTLDDTNGDVSKEFSDGTVIDVNKVASLRTYSITAGNKSSLTTMRLKDDSSLSLVRGANITGIKFNNNLVMDPGEGFDATHIVASKGTVSWKKKAVEGVVSDIVITMNKDSVDVGRVTIKSGTSFTTIDGAFLESKQGEVVIDNMSTAESLVLADGTKIQATVADTTITIKHGRWDLSKFQGTIELGGKSTGMVFDGVKLASGEDIKLTTSSNASFTLSAKGTIDGNLSVSKGTLTFTLPHLVGVSTVFTLQGATPSDINKVTLTVAGGFDGRISPTPLGNLLTQFTIENAKFKSSSEGALNLTMPAGYTHVLKDDTKGDFVVVKSGSNYDINDRGITFANGMRFVYANQDSPIEMTVNPNGRYTVTSKPKADTELVIVTNSNSAFAQFNVNNIKVTPKYGSGGAFGINENGAIDVTLENVILNDGSEKSAEIYNTGEITLEFPGDTKTLALKQFKIISKDEEISKIIVKDSPGQSYAQVDFANVSGKFKIDVTAGTPQFALKDGISVTAVSGTLPSFNIDSGNLDLAKTPVTDGGQAGQIQVSLANTKEAIAVKAYTTFSGLQVTLNKLAGGETESSFKLEGKLDDRGTPVTNDDVRGMELVLSGVNPLLSSANFTGDVNIVVPTDASFKTFVLSDTQSSFTVDAAGGEAKFKLSDGNFVSSSAGELEYTLNSNIAVTIDKDVTIARTTGFSGNPTFDLVNGKLDFSVRNTGNTTVALLQTAPQITITQSDQSILTVGPGQRTVDFINGEVTRASVTVFPGTSRKMAEGVTFLNPNPVPKLPADPRYELHIGNDTPNQWDFASSDNYPFKSVERAAAVPITITVDDAKTTVDQVFKLRADGDNIPDITITVDKEKSASFKVNGDGTFGGWLSGDMSVKIDASGATVPGSLVIGTSEANVTLTVSVGNNSTFVYGTQGIDLTNFTGDVALIKAPASKFKFAASSVIKLFETLGGVDFSFGVSGGVPGTALVENGEIKIKDKSTITLDNGIALAADGTDADVKFNLSEKKILGAAGKLTVTNKDGSAATIKRASKFDLTTNTDSGFTVDLSNDNLSSLSGSLTLVASDDLIIDGAQGAVRITISNHKITLNKVEITGNNFNIADGKIDFKTTTFTGGVNSLSGAPATTFVLSAPDVPAGVELTATSGAFKVASGVLDADETAGADYISKNNFKLPAKATLKINDMTFEAMGPAIKTVSVYTPPSPPSGNYTGYDLTAIGGTAADDKIVVKIASAVEIKVFKLNGAELTVEAGQSASFTVKADGTLGKYESGDITVKLLGTSAVIGDVTITGTANDTFKLANGKFDLRNNTNNLTITVANSAQQAITFILERDINLVAKAKTLSSFTVTAGGVLSVSTLAGAFTVTLPSKVDLSGFDDITSVKAINGPATFDLADKKPVSLDKSRGTLEIDVANGQTVSLAQSVSVISWPSGAKVRIVNGKIDTYMSGNVQIKLTGTTDILEGTPDTTIKFDADSGFGADSQVVYKKGADGSFMIDSAGGTPLINFSENGSGMFEVKLKGKGTGNIPKVVLVNAEITPIAIGLAGSEIWLAEMIVKNKKLTATSKGDLRVKILEFPQDAFKFKMLDGTKILTAPGNTEFKISNGRYGGLIVLPTPGFEIELGSILTHTWWPFNSPTTRFEMKYIQGTKLRYEVFPDPDVEGAFLPTVLNTDAGSVPGVVIMKALQNVVIDGLGLVPANGIMVFKNNILQSDEYYYALRVE